MLFFVRSTNSSNTTRDMSNKASSRAISATSKEIEGPDIPQCHHDYHYHLQGDKGKGDKCLIRTLPHHQNSEGLKVLDALHQHNRRCLSLGLPKDPFEISKQKETLWRKNHSISSSVPFTITVPLRARLTTPLATLEELYCCHPAGIVWSRRPQQLNPSGEKRRTNHPHRHASYVTPVLKLRGCWRLEE